MATVIATISASEMERRCAAAAVRIWDNPDTNIVLKPGIFQASDWSPGMVVEQVIRWLSVCFSHAENSDSFEEPEWNVRIFKRSRGDYILKARRVS